MRIGDSSKSVLFDGNMTSYYHVECFMKQKYIPDFRAIKNVWRMRWEDQIRVRDLVLHQHAEFLKNYKDKIPKSLLSKRKRDETDHSSPEPAKRQKTKKSDTQESYAKLTVPKLRKELHSRSLSTSGRKQELIQRLTENDTNSSDVSAGTEQKEEPMELEYSEHITLNQIDNEAELKEQVGAWWNIYDELEENLYKDDLLDLLEQNKMSTEGSYESLLTRCTFGILFGRTQVCPACNSGELQWKGNKYKCQGGNISEWAKCENSCEADEVQCELFTIPESLTDKPCLRKFNKAPCKPVERVVIGYKSPHRLCSFKAQIKVNQTLWLWSILT